MDSHYATLVLESYEDEVAGAAYFDGLAAAFPRHAHFLARCAALERTTADRLGPLLTKYGLPLRDSAPLRERGARDARLESGVEWRALLTRSVESYGRYVDAFRALEALGPPEDQPILQALTAHEIQLIDWMRAELASL